jgi:ribose transport system ATP-binding protein
VSTALLRIVDVSKTFPGQKALDHVAFEAKAGEIHALLGHNGSGKSTLIKILSGYHVADLGAIAYFEGKPLHLDRHRSVNTKMRFVHQGLGLVEGLNAVDSIALGTGYAKGTMNRIDWAEQARLTRALLARIGVDLDIWRSVSEMAPVERTAIAIARALKGWAGSDGLLVLDEPTAALPPREVDRLFAILEELRSAGFAIVYVSHRLDEILRIADYVTVLRGGRHVATRAVTDVDRKALIRLMVGADIEPENSHATTQPDSRNVVLKVKDLASNELRGINIDVYEGEILGIAGLLGSGREEFPYVVLGAASGSGQVWLRGKQVARRSPRSLRNLGVGLVPSDRVRQGAILPFDIRENMTLPNLRAHRRGIFVDQNKERRFANVWMEELDIEPRSLDRSFRTLSGGNQQKVILSKWLGRSPDVLILDEPTAGVDIATRSTIYELIRRRAALDTSFVICTSDVEDLVAVCNRVVVLNSGLVTDELGGEEVTEPRILAAMLRKDQDIGGRV